MLRPSQSRPLDGRLAQLGDDRREDLVQVAEDRVVGARDDRRVLVLVDDEDPLRALQPTMCWIAPLIPHAM